MLAAAGELHCCGEQIPQHSHTQNKLLTTCPRFICAQIHQAEQVLTAFRLKSAFPPGGCGGIGLIRCDSENKDEQIITLAIVMSLK